jgi:WD40 repeat protein
MKALFILIPIVFFAFPAYSQTAPPDVDIYLADLQTKKGKVEIGTPSNVTNREGYDNQPCFSIDGKGFFYTSMRNNQTDIYFYDLKTMTSKPLTQTPESEYSAALTPDGKYFSTVRVEKDGTQRLWKFEQKNPANASLVLENIKPVGYYVWANETQLALFVLGEPNTLQLASVTSGTSQQIENSVGRSFHRIPKQKDKVSFIHKAGDKEWYAKSLDIKTLKTEELVKMLEGCEDICWTKDNILLMSKGAKIYQWNAQKDSDWVEIADFSSLGIKQITRIAVNPKSNKIAFVAAM